MISSYLLHILYEDLIWFSCQPKVFVPTKWNCVNGMVVDTISDMGGSLHIVHDICCSWMRLVIWVDVAIYNISWSLCTIIWHDKVTGFEMAKYTFEINQILFKVKYYVVKAFVYLETNITFVHSMYRNGPRAYDHWNGPVSRVVRADVAQWLYMSKDAFERPNIACHN